MAGILTRINNNQISSASAGNAYLGINAAVKVQSYTITGGLLANNLTYGNNLTVQGNLTVTGTTTSVNTVNTIIADPLIVLADGQTTGTPAVDIGFVGLRGNQNSAVMAWKESQSQFVVALSNTDNGGSSFSNTTFNINSYADFKANNITANANLSVTGNIAVSGNVIGNLAVSGNISGGNLLTTGLISATGNAYMGNSINAGTSSVTGNITAGGNIAGGNILTSGLISATANVTAGNIQTAGQLSATGNIVTNANLTVNQNAVITGNLLVQGNVTFINSNVITTNDLYIELANNQTTYALSLIHISEPTRPY